MLRRKKFLVVIGGLALVALTASVLFGTHPWAGSGRANASIAQPVPGQGDQMSAAAAAQAAPGADPFVFQYAGEFLCGTISIAQQAAGYVGPGTYNTEIGIHNPNNDPVVYIEKKVVPLPQPEQEGFPTPRRYEALHPDGAKQIDCNDILTFFPAGTTCFSNPALPQFCKGYVVVEAARPIGAAGLIPAQLDVTVTTTVTSPQSPGFSDTAIEQHLIPGKVVNYPCWSVNPPQCP